MGPMRRLFRLGVGRPRLKQAVDWEIEHHIAERTDRLVEEGLSPSEARREAERRFGKLARQRQRIVATDRRRLMMTKRGQFQDAVRTGARQAARGVVRHPGLSVAVILTLGLGIGVNAAMFGVVDRLLLRPPEQVSEPDQVRRILRDGMFFRQPAILPVVTYPDLADLRTLPEFVSVGAVASTRPVTLGRGEEARQVRVARATHDFFTTLGVRARLGRFFDAEDDAVGTPVTAVLSYEFWQASFGGAPDVVGTTLELAGREVPVIGVAPQGFTGIDLGPVDAWLPAVASEYANTGSDRFFTSRGYWWLRPVVRIRSEESLQPGLEKATAMHVNSRADAIAAGHFDGEAKLVAAPLIEARGPRASNESKVARWLAGVSLVVLFIACANVANLLLAQGAGRRREVAVRLSLGVSRGRLLREMVLETLMLALLGGVAALALAHWGGDVIRAFLIPDVYWTTSSLSVRVISFTAVMSVAAGLLAGLGPALQSTRADLARDLAAGGRGSSPRTSRVRSALTVAQATLSVVLLVGAGLFIRSVVEVRSVDLGLDVDRLLLAILELQGEDPDPLEATRLYEEARDVVRRIPGVAAVASTDMPYQWASVEDLSVPGLDSLPVPPGGGPFYYGVSPGYMKTLGLELIQGRPILETDVEGAPRVAVINRMMARAFWPDRNPIGQCFHYAGDEECTTVVGVVEDSSREGMEDTPHLAYHLPLAQTGQAPAGLYARTEEDPGEVAALVASALRTFSPRVRFATVQPLRELLEPETRAWTLGAVLFTAFGLLALLVAAIGLYSVLAFDVARRTKEIGIRAALGAHKAQVLRSVVAVAARTAFVGIVLGLGIAFVAAPFIEHLLFRVDGTDPTVLGTVALVLLAVAVLASAVPGLRATRVDPMETLRAE